jgi:uncharacterized membrane protein YfcA
MPGMHEFAALFGGAAALGAALSLAAGGFAKGVVGFALPLIALSAMASFLPIEAAVGLLIVPTLASNLFQGLRNGLGAALSSLRDYWRLNLILMAMIAASARLVVTLPDRFLFAMLGAAIAGFGLSQLAGWRPVVTPGRRRLAEVGAGLVGGFFGGISGIWGPPVVMYLLAAGVPRVEMVRAQALSFLAGSLVLVGAHINSGVLNAVTAPASAWLTLPTLAAMFAGYLVQDRLDQERFRRVTLVVLVVAGLNLLRRALV